MSRNGRIAALILGSERGHLADTADGVAIPWANLPGFPHVGVSGLNPKLGVGDLIEHRD